jgi:hypothetical protein
MSQNVTANQDTIVILSGSFDVKRRRMYYFIKGSDSFATIGKKVRHIHEALEQTRYMDQRGMTNISIQDDAGHTIDGNDLLACVNGEKALSDDLQAHYVS